MNRMPEKSGGKKISEKFLVGGATFFVAVGSAACGGDAGAKPAETNLSTGSVVEEGAVPSEDGYLPEDVVIDIGEDEDGSGATEPNAYESSGKYEIIVGKGVDTSSKEYADALVNAEATADAIGHDGERKVLNILIFIYEDGSYKHQIRVIKQDGKESVFCNY